MQKQVMDEGDGKAGSRNGSSLATMQNERIPQVITYLLEKGSPPNTLASLAAALEVTESKLRQLADGLRPKRTTDKEVAINLEEAWGLPIGILQPECSEDRYEAFMRELERGTRSIRRFNGWLYGSFRQEQLEEGLAPSQLAIIISPNCYNDGTRDYTRYMVTQNALRGVEYHYIVPGSADLRENLDKLIDFVGERVEAEGGGGKVPQVHEYGQKTDDFWRQTTHICLFLNKPHRNNYHKDLVLNLAGRDLVPTAAFRELYLHNDDLDYVSPRRTLKEFCWASICSRELRDYVSLVNSWDIKW